MKLSKKGKSRIHEMIDCAFEAHPDDAKGVQVLAKKYLTECDDFELEPDDFQCGYFQNGKDHITLTLEEAKELALKLMSNDEFFFRQTGEFDYYTEALWNCLIDKIEQAEGK